MNDLLGIVMRLHNSKKVHVYIANASGNTFQATMESAELHMEEQVSTELQCLLYLHIRDTEQVEF